RKLRPARWIRIISSSASPPQQRPASSAVHSVLGASTARIVSRLIVTTLSRDFVDTIEFAFHGASGDRKIMRNLHVHPKLGPIAQKLAEPQGDVRCDCHVLGEDGVKH
ncbi:MAG TPA: hypothetical protein VHT51_02040, partial [Micropepsaceae bacterium]|nr:hypothetical protein [Micropepsaceae bacterium]